MRKISRVFELYRPKILAEFLQFIKDNPEETFVYVLQHPPQNINIMSASDFGYLVICLSSIIFLLFMIDIYIITLILMSRKNI